MTAFDPTVNDYQDDYVDFLEDDGSDSYCEAMQDPNSQENAECNEAARISYEEMDS